jgi:hypothetical protein
MLLAVREGRVNKSYLCRGRWVRLAREQLTYEPSTFWCGGPLRCYRRSSLPCVFVFQLPAVRAGCSVCVSGPRSTRQRSASSAGQGALRILGWGGWCGLIAHVSTVQHVVCVHGPQASVGSWGVHGGTGTYAARSGAISPGHAGEDNLGQELRNRELYLGRARRNQEKVFKDNK